MSTEPTSTDPISTEPATNRDLYLGIQALVARHADSDRSLEAFLTTLWSLAREERERRWMTAGDLLAMLDRAWSDPVPPFDDAWRALPPLIPDEARGFERWEMAILRQVRDHRDMAEAGMLEDEDRWFGMDSPRGGRWYNFSPAGYLEGAVAGTFGGWRAEDATRMAVPGPVAVVDASGRVTTAAPSADPEPVRPLPPIGWDLFIHFLDNGQWYE